MQNGAIGHDRPKFLNKIQRQGWLSGARPMKIPNVRIQTSAFQRLDAVICQQRVGKRQHRITGIFWGAAIAPLEMEGTIIREDQVLKNAEIDPCGLTFGTPQRFFTLQCIQGRFNLRKGVFCG